MADIANPQVIRFANERLRPLMDRMYSTWMEAVSVNQDYVSNGIGAKITAAGSANLVADGSATDGRTRISGNDIFNAITAATAYIAFVTNGIVLAADRSSVITKPHVNRL